MLRFVWNVSKLKFLDPIYLNKVEWNWQYCRNFFKIVTIVVVIVFGAICGTCSCDICGSWNCAVVTSTRVVHICRSESLSLKASMPDWLPGNVEWRLIKEYSNSNNIEGRSICKIYQKQTNIYRLTFFFLQAIHIICSSIFKYCYIYGIQIINKYKYWLYVLNGHCTLWYTIHNMNNM